MSRYQCRECGEGVTTADSRCRKCGCQTPFTCAECARPISSLTVGVNRTRKYPLGGFDRAGQPLCADHRLTRCHGCRELQPHHRMTRCVIGTREDRSLRRGMDPRTEEVHVDYCPRCAAAAPSRPAPGGRNPPSGLLLWGILFLIAACVLVPVLVLTVGQSGR